MQMPTYSIDFNWQEPEDVKDSAVVVICNSNLTEIHGDFSNGVHNFLGKDLSNYLEHAKIGLKEGKLPESHCMKSPAFAMEENGVKMLIHCSLDEPIVKGVFEESYLRFGYLNAMARAAEEKCDSIVLPVPVLILPRKHYTRGCRVLLQSICMFIEKYPNTSIKRFSIVSKVPCVLRFLKTIWKQYGKSVSSKHFMELQDKLEEQCKGLEINYGSFNVKFFTNFKFLDRHRTKIQAEKVEKLKKLCKLCWKSPQNEIVKSPQKGGNEIVKSPLKGGNKDDNGRGQQSSDEEPPSKTPRVDPVFNTPSSSEGSAKRSLNLKYNKQKSKEARASTARKSRTSSSSSNAITPNAPLTNVPPQAEDLQGTSATQEMPIEVTATAVKSSNSTPALNATPIRPKKREYEHKRKAKRLCLQKARRVHKANKSSTFNFDPRKLDDFLNLVKCVLLLQSFTHDEIGESRRHIKSQLTFDVGGPKDMSPEEVKRRQLCRMPIHVYNEKCYDDGKVYEPISDVFVPLWKEFMGHKDLYEKAPVETPKEQKKADSFDKMEFEEDSFENINLPTEELVSESEREEEDTSADESAGEAIEDEQKTDNASSDEGSSAKKARISTEPCLTPQPFEADPMDELFGEMYGQQYLDQLNEDVGGFTRKVLGHYTKGRKCDENCPKMDANEAAVIHKVLSDNLNRMEGAIDEFKLVDLWYEFKGEKKSVAEWVDRYIDCYQGLRSLAKRYAEFSKLIDIASKCHEVVTFKNKEEMIDLMRLDDLPSSLSQKFLNLYAEPENQEHHEQGYVEKKFEKHIKSFQTENEEQETDVCDICHALHAPKNLTEYRKVDFLQWLDYETRNSKRSRIFICAMCKKCKDLPAAALANNFKPSKCPDELKCLNVLERMLIERARANMKVFFLNSITDKKTSMKGTKGALLVLPTDIESTMNHVCDTLPSGANLSIQVRTGWEKKYIVSLPKIISALKWLKENNMHYKDIKINEGFNFTLGENVFFERKDVTQNDANKLIARDNKKEDNSHLLTQDQIETQPMQRVHQPNDETPAFEKYTLLRHKYTPIPVDTPHNDAKIFPVLHPYGDDGLNNQRQTAVKVAKYVRTRLRCADRRWAQNANWLCYMYGRKQQLNITSVQGIQARIRRGTKGKDFDLEDEKTQKSISAAYAKTRGFPQYWKSVKYALRSHVAVYGAPTWFLTLNPNVKGWTGLHRLYEKQLGYKVTEKNIEQAIAKDPFHFARFWRRRVASLWNNVLLKKDGPLGEITHYFHRVEYQHRGTQHIHCVIWTKNRPAPDASPQVITEFIDAHVTARLPDKKKEPKLHDLVTTQQSHWKTHSKTCRRPVRVKRRMMTTRCRFGFPRPVLRRTRIYDMKKKARIPGFTMRPYSLARTENETHINDYNSAILLAWEANIDLQYIPSDAKDVVNYVASYTTKGEKAKKLDNKAALKRYAMEGMSLSKALFHLGLKFAEEREVGLLEIIDELMGHDNFKFDQAHVFIPTDPSNERQRILKPKNKLKDDEDVHEYSWLDNFYPNRIESLENCSLYNIMTNFEIVTTRPGATDKRHRTIFDDEALEKRKKKNQGKNINNNNSDSDDDSDSDSDSDSDIQSINGNNNNDKDDDGDEDYIDEDEEKCTKIQDTTIRDKRYHLKCKLSPFYSHRKIKNGDKIPIQEMDYKCMRKMKQKVARFFLKKLNLDNDESVEDYYGRLVRLFVPWRDEHGILEKFNAVSYAEVWIAHLEDLKNKDERAHADLTKLMKGYTVLQDQEAEVGLRMERIKKAKQALQVDEEVEEALEIQSRDVDVEKHAEDVEKLNTVQRRIYDYVIGRVQDQNVVRENNSRIFKENQERKKNNQKQEPYEIPPEPIQMFISGTAGTGKSFLINTIADRLTMEYVTENNSGLKPAVLLDAPTGIAALGIKGNTIHSLLGIEVVQADHKGEEEFEELSGKKFDDLKFLFSNVRLVITDEISMVSNITFEKMNRRMRQISGKRIPFGGYNVLMFGDLLQLPPVKAPHVFKTISPYTMRRVFGACDAGANLWSSLDYEELTENMRQGEHLELAQMFERIRTAAQTKQDVELLMTRLIPAKNKMEPTIEEIAQHFVNNMLSIDPCSMALFALNEEVDELNRRVLDINKLKVIRIDAIDCVDYQATRDLERGKEGALSRVWQRLSIKRVDHAKDLRNRKNMTAPAGSSFCDMYMHGGLPPQLTVGIGSRVMLRKNIKISERLVNGATGVVTRMEMNDADGSVKRIYVKFDGNEEFPIEKSTARFQRNDEIMTRDQFPLVIAYAATIHKAQGLTLNNVVIRPRSIFSNGMFYVAVSRVTHINGLWLAGFDAQKISIDDEAYMESNRLRQKILLPALRRGAWTGNIQDFVAANRGREEDEQPTAVVAAVEQKRRQEDNKRKQRIVYETLKTGEEVMDIIPSVNRHKSMADDRFTESVLIAMIHALAMMEYVRIEIASFDNENVEEPKLKLAFKNLKECVTNRLTTVWEIVDVERFNEYRVSGDGNSIKNAVTYLFDEVLPEAILNMFSRECNLEIFCPKCKDVQFKTIRRPIIWLTAGKPNSKLYEEIEKYFETPEETGETCEMIVEGKMCERNLEIENKLGSKSRYLLVGQDDGGFNSTYQPLPLDPFPLGSSRFLLVGAISLGNIDDVSNDEIDSVKCWYKNPEGGWFKMEPGDAYIPENNIQLKSMHFFVLVEKPRERQRAADKEREAEEEKVVDNFDYIKNAVDDDNDDNVEMESVQSSNSSRRRSASPLQAIVPVGRRQSVSPPPRRQQQQQQQQQHVNNDVPMGRRSSISPVRRIDRRRPTEAELYAIGVVPGLSLINRRDDCFVNTAINILYSMISFRNTVINNIDVYPDLIPQLLAKLFANGLRSVAELRPLLKGFETGRQDVNAVFEKIVEELLFYGEECSAFRAKVVRRLACSEDPTHSETYANEYEYSTVVLMSKDMPFQEIFDMNQIVRENCSKCNMKEAESGNFKVFRTKEVDAGEYHVVSVSKDSPHLRITLDTRRSVSMFGKEWMLVAFGDYISTPKHYVSWHKTTNQKWICRSDHQIVDIVDAQEMRLEDYGANILVFRKKGDDSVVVNDIPEAVGMECEDVMECKDESDKKKDESMDYEEEKMKENDEEEEGAVSKPYLLLPNVKGTICFLNTALNIVYACKPLRRAIMRKSGYTTDRKKQTQLDMVAAIFKGDALDAEVLRSTLSEYANPQKQFDASSALDTLLLNIFPKSIEEEMWRSIAVSVVLFKECSSCGYKKERVSHRQFVRFTMKREGRFEDVWENAWAPTPQICSNCKGRMEVGTRIGQSNGYLIVFIDRTSQTELSKFYKLDRDAWIDIAGEHWTMEAYSEYIKIWNKKLKVSTGHYRTWAKEDDGEWKCVDDGKIAESKQGAEDVTIKMMVLKKF